MQPCKDAIFIPPGKALLILLEVRKYHYRPGLSWQVYETIKAAIWSLTTDPPNPVPSLQGWPAVHIRANAAKPPQLTCLDLSSTSATTQRLIFIFVWFYSASVQAAHPPIQLSQHDSGWQLQEQPNVTHRHGERVSREKDDNIFPFVRWKQVQFLLYVIGKALARKKEQRLGSGLTGR